MRIYPNDNSNFKASIKIYSMENLNSPIRNNNIKYVENKFAEMTHSEKGHIDLILYDRYNYKNAKPDRLLFREGNYMDSVDTYIKHISDNKELVNKLVGVFKGFKKIKEIKDSINKTF